MRTSRLAILTIPVLAPLALAQWDPGNGQWGKTDPADLRVMTWNVEDGICRTNAKVDAFNNWSALVRIVAAMQPDILILQEAGDNSGNGTGSGVDSVANLTTTLDLFLHGGTDPFEGGAVTSFVQDLAPGYDLPHVFVSGLSDNFNRNVILSRYPFADLNGDTEATYIDIDFVLGVDCAPGGKGGIRGFMFADIDLPDAVYAGDVVIGNAHLKAGFGGSDHDQRIDSARNVARWIHELLNGSGTTTPDPDSTILDVPQATMILDDDTPVIWGGDMNEDEAANGGTRGPVSYLVDNCSTGSGDGTDRDGTASLAHDSRDPFTNSNDTRGSSKLDYIMYQDSIATARRGFVFNSLSANANGGLPAQLAGFPINPGLASGQAADHLPVIVDFILPAPTATPPGDFSLVAPPDAQPTLEPTLDLSWSASADVASYTLTIATDAALTNVVLAVPGLGVTSFAPASGDLGFCSTYFWSVEAFNDHGSTVADNAPRSFMTRAQADLSGSTDPNNPGYGVPDGAVDANDFFYFLDRFAADDTAIADLTGSADPNNPAFGVPDGIIDANDFFFYLTLFATPCP